MLRNLAIVVSFVCLAFVAAIITSCGSSGTHLGTTCTGGPFNVVGDWQGALTAGGGSSNLTGLINTQGEALFFDSDPFSGPNSDPASGSVAALPSITGTCSFSGNVTLYETPAAAVITGSSTVTGTAQGNVTSASSINATATINGSSASFTLNSYTPLTGSVAALSGSLLAEDPAQSFQMPLAFTPTTGNNMSFTNNTALSNCTTSGTLTQEGSNNVFDFSVTFSGTAGGCPTPSTVTGLAFESSSDIFALNGSAPGTYLYAVSSTSAIVVEIFKQAVDADLQTQTPHSFAAKPSAFIFR